MWYKCLNPSCGYIFHSTEEQDKCPDCGKQDFRTVTFDEQVEIANSKVKTPKNSSNSSNDDEPVLEIIRDNKPVKQEPEIG